ncbi:hypothetical protein CLAFUW4_02068 [Fulvia fulva]|uniref:Uncharacterized protein n=1 Tax=Passalora fulva TaxID=5499 RepID=A0A9Q8L941_PASFU|nr:uncharacterized protein CLAFUR5_02061 [Fulvia fulva]KAK4635931.1 hypothetical protein CLAFUR4_02064 [Fulvia fulva]KAK4637671.1 hypothetical protein CLAFUR0_02067 [Fulvia fulva]UJO13060.1 hypothetical protein CLAFUR5_02061 [Fulvia fulva]WPV08092.1 hypothetical protein CLAFUW4_02068 [Fulvia fulva]WPV24354.1 hypothetical protein CLAFUW7_02068 [Fulvia fulva]
MQCSIPIPRDHSIAASEQNTMSSNLMDTEKGGEQTQYEGEYTDVQPHKKSGGQLGETATMTDPSQTDAAKQQAAARGERTAENIRYGQTISEGGMSGFTTGQQGGATQGGYGQVQGSAKDGGEGDGDSAESQRRKAGYGGESDHNREVGA